MEFHLSGHSDGGPSICTCIGPVRRRERSESELTSLFNKWPFSNKHFEVFSLKLQLNGNLSSRR